MRVDAADDLFVVLARAEDMAGVAPDDDLTPQQRAAQRLLLVAEKDVTDLVAAAADLPVAASYEIVAFGRGTGSAAEMLAALAAVFEEPGSIEDVPGLGDRAVLRVDSAILAIAAAATCGLPLATNRRGEPRGGDVVMIRPAATAT